MKIRIMSRLVIAVITLTGLWECSIINTFRQNIINVREHMGKAGGHDDAATKAHHVGEEPSHPGASLGLLPGDPASSDRQHGNQTNDPGGQTEDKHGDDLGGQEVTFHLERDLGSSEKI